MQFALIALLPVVAFVLVLRLIDSYALVPVRESLRAVIVGMACGGVSRRQFLLSMAEREP